MAVLEIAGPRRTNALTPNPNLWEVCVGRVVVNHLGSLTVQNTTQCTPTGASRWILSASGTVMKVFQGPELA